MNINEIMEEYISEPIVILPTYYRRRPAGFVEPGYWTTVSAFLFPLKGEGYFKLDNQSFRFRPGMVIHGCPGKWLTSGNLTDKSLEFYIMYYRHDKDSGGWMHRAYEMEIGSSPGLFATLKMLADVSKHPDSFSKFQAKALVYTVLSELFSIVKKSRSNETQSMVEEARGYIEFHHMRQHTLCDLAGRYGMCPKYFSEVFKKYTGISPIDYLIAYRMKEAHRLLTSTCATVKEISEMVGYSDAYYFSRLFKKQYGLAPTQLRALPIEQAN